MPTRPTRWEYRAEYLGVGPRLLRTLNELGAEGWELVTLDPATQGVAGDGTLREYEGRAGWFKRPMPS